MLLEIKKYIFKMDSSSKAEKYIQHLYKVIGNLETELQSVKNELTETQERFTESQKQIREAKKLCDEREKFILFRESQLQKSEDIIGELKQRLSHLCNNKMASSSSSTGARSGPALISLETASRGELINTLSNIKDEYYNYAMGRKKVPNFNTIQNMNEQYDRASELLSGKIGADLRDAEETGRLTSLDRYVALQEEWYNTKESLNGAHNEVRELQAEVAELRGDVTERNTEIDNLHAEILAYEEFERNLGRMLEESNTVRGDARQLEAIVEQLRAEINRKDNRIAWTNIRLDGTTDRLNDALGMLKLEQIENKRLRRQRLVLRIANQQLQIRLMNAPVIAPPQPITQVWLSL
jgi:predicted  nucleic acid-binding Zn-ribbon protein